MPSARYTNPDHNFGEFVMADGRITSGPLPPNAADIRLEYDKWIAEGNKPEPYNPPPPDPALALLGR